ncbi:MAG: DUF4097 family beta strand repeat protein [Microbacterium sp.]|uniref:DUF4097 family beta strand repeat-containing protein n=1 Tax=Microbacterium sp. TaxID=51671 RepID=UPI001DD132AD|nr:DUF4097 family beta strand repeat-containing protein [Microbacterium sp.]MBW8764249.1 DUF4097 family beta strand repeat protein [Microbacterium sp.]
MSISTPPPARTAGQPWITITLAVFGGLALAGAGATAAVAASADLDRTDVVQRIDVDGVESLDLDASASDVRVEFGDVDEAELSVKGGRGGAWTIERDGDELLVRSPDSGFGWWFGRWFDDDRTAVLTLPNELEGLDASFRLNAGGLDITGSYGELELELAAGDLNVDGSARSLEADVSAGGADLLLDGVDEADLSVAAGDLSVELTGSAPSRVTITANAGSADLTLPDTGYHVTQSVSAGELDNRLEQSSDSRNSIEVTLSAGTVTLRPGS